MFAAGLVALAGCYSPAVSNCTVSCGSPGDCVRGQVCGSDGFCAAPAMAGHCRAALPDAARADGSPHASLHVQIIGRGSVIVDGHGTCSALDPQRGECEYDLAPDVAQSIHAFPIQLDQTFTSWTSVMCNGENASCTFVPVAATSVIAKFDHY